MQDEQRARRGFLALWVTITLAKLCIAARLPLFVDEAFYWQEGRHLAAAYSDLPGLTAWLARLGTDIGGQHVLALRAPFLLLAALIPWLIAGMGRRWFGPVLGWQAGMLALLMPLAGSLGLLALPDVPMAFAAVLCAGAGARLLQRVDLVGVALLALGLVIGALSHYRFIGVIGMGCVALLLLPQGRRLLGDKRVWAALLVGAAAWLPLIYWNLQNADAGLRFQLVDRHPWSFQSEGWWFLAVQALLVTPLLFVLLLQVPVHGLRQAKVLSEQWRYFALLGGISTLGFFALGFFADVERVSFHWPLPGYLALLVAAPPLLQRWPHVWRLATWVTAATGLVLVLAYYLMLSVPPLRAQLGQGMFYNENFAGWDDLAKAVGEELALLPAGTPILADNFKVGAELGFAFDNSGIQVLDHLLNHKHGRAPQLRLWGLESDGRREREVLLVVDATAVKLSKLLEHYQGLCARVGVLSAPRVVNADHGARRFLLFALPATRQDGPCITPALAHINHPSAGQAVPSRFEVGGWAIKDAVGVEAVTVTLNGKPVGQADYGSVDAWVEATLNSQSRDPHFPRVGFKATVDAAGLAPGKHWLGLVVVGRDGSTEAWSELPIIIDTEASPVTD